MYPKNMLILLLFVITWNDINFYHILVRILCWVLIEKCIIKKLPKIVLRTTYVLSKFINLSFLTFNFNLFCEFCKKYFLKTLFYELLLLNFL